MEKNTAILTFGKYSGKTFEDVREDTKYCEWILLRASPTCESMKQFEEWLRGYAVWEKQCATSNCKNVGVFYDSTFHGTISGFERIFYHYKNVKKSTKMFCYGCKTDDMTNPKCVEEGCGSPAIYGIEPKQPKYCGEHRLSTKCGKSECEYKREKQWLCSGHKRESIPFVLCGDCGDFAEYGDEGVALPTSCLRCKTDTMTRIIYRLCTEEGCAAVATHGPIITKRGVILESSARTCSEHKKAETYNLFKMEFCLEEGCKNLKRWAYPSSVNGDWLVDIFCQQHRKEDMISSGSAAKGCRGCPYSHVGSHIVKGIYYCSECFIRTFPNDPKAKRMRTKNKELAVLKMLAQEFPGREFVHDKPLWTGNCDCTHRRRIDFRILIGNTLLAIEVDEGQHKNYEEDAAIRYNDLYMIHSGKWIFIRYNPDSYKNEKGKVVNPSDSTRLPALKDFITEQMGRAEREENTELLEVYQMFFDYRVVAPPTGPAA